MVVDSPTAALLTSTLYPLPYPANIDCTLLIHQHPDQFVTLDFMSFDLEDSENCASDIFQVCATNITICATQNFYLFISSTSIHFFQALSPFTLHVLEMPTKVCKTKYIQY